MTTAPAGSTKESELRQRASAANKNADGTKKTQQAKEISSAALETAQSSFSFLDLLRAIAGLALVSTIASYAVTSGESFTWGVMEPSQRPWFLNPAAIKARFAGPLELTNDELGSYDGSDASKPILLALNRTIYDVSSSPHVYGPGGMYSSLAAKDASRSYITTCFDPVDDLVPYFGGLEEAYVPVWLSKKPWKEEMVDIGKSAEMMGGQDADDLIDAIRKKIGRKHVKKLQKEAYEEGLEKVKLQVQTWEKMFANKNYPIVGRVVGVEEEDPTKWRHLGFCEAARKLRPSLGDSLQKAMEAVGKGDKMNINMGQAMKNMGSKMPKKPKKSKKAKTEGDEASEGESDDPLMGNADHASNEKANVRMEDMMPGGKYYGKDKKKAKKRPGIVEEKVRTNLEDGDAEKAHEDIEQLKKDSGEEPVIPDAVPDAVLNDEQRAEL